MKVCDLKKFLEEVKSDDAVVVVQGRDSVGQLLSIQRVRAMSIGGNDFAIIIETEEP